MAGVFAVSFWIAAVFPVDAGAGFPAGAPEATLMSGHGTMHMVGGMVGYLTLYAAFVVLAHLSAAHTPAEDSGKRSGRSAEFGLRAQVITQAEQRERRAVSRKVVMLLIRSPENSTTWSVGGS
ncbi:DUF998 domain-containing protein [Streptomyces sp. S1]|uniref:DUF998 domain-containing protein n=1 Tax=Streptomyces sp. S1 TaxID=718288 RepID=UPI003D708385